MPKLAVNAFGIPDGQDKFAFRLQTSLVHHNEFCGIAILHEVNTIGAEKLSGMDLRPWWRVVIPNHLLVRVNLRHPELVREENVSVWQQDGITNLASAI